VSSDKIRVVTFLLKVTSKCMMCVLRCNFIHNDIDLMEPSVVRPASAVPQSMIIAVPTSNSLFPESSWPLAVFGSTADSPPHSVIDSPSPSPTAMLFDSAFDVFPGLVGSFPFQTAFDTLYWMTCAVCVSMLCQTSLCFFVINLAESYYVRVAIVFVLIFFNNSQLLKF